MKKLDVIVKMLGRKGLRELRLDKKFETIRENIGQALSLVQDAELVEFAKNKVEDTKNQVFSALNIPSKDDVDNLTRKLVALEKKFNTVRRHINK